MYPDDQNTYWDYHAYIISVIKTNSTVQSVYIFNASLLNHAYTTVLTVSAYDVRVKHNKYIDKIKRNS